MIKYQTDLHNVTPENLNGFFVGWPNKPSQEQLYKILQNSSYIELAISKNNVVGFVNAISDKVLSAYIPLLEVLPEYQHQGIGADLVTRLLNQLEHLYMIDLVCDENLNTFYKKFNFKKYNAQIIRQYKVLDNKS